MRPEAESTTIAFVGNYVPRQCGIATFTTDLAEAVAKQTEANVIAVAINDRPEGYTYPDRVTVEILQNKPSDYTLAADVLNMRHVGVACLQHEYGIFGGKAGGYILNFLKELRMPVVATLHTVLKNPKPAEKHVLCEIVNRADRIVVMSEKAIEFLTEIYDAPADRIRVIHHGIPQLAFVDPNYFKGQFGAEGKKVLLTFGLLSPGKGIEYMIQALPKIVEKHDDVLYIVLGATHPNIKRIYGEEYRLSLQRLAEKLGVKQHVVFHNRFATLEELCEFLGATDIYVTPYVNEAQIVSGTLAYALGAGKAIVSTPYWYAEEMLAEGRGRLVPFCDSDALAQAIIELLDDEVERHAMRRRAYDFSRQMVWDEVAKRYLETFAEVKEERTQRPRPIYQIPTVERYGPEPPEINLTHLCMLTDDTGILQHAKYSVPNRNEGYCTDDVARALIVVLLAEDFYSDQKTLARLASTYLAFLGEAFNERRRRFRNFMRYDRRWREQFGSEDSHGRALWSLGMAARLSEDEDLVYFACDLFHRALPTVGEFAAPRAIALSVLGASAYLARFAGETEVRRILRKSAERLRKQFERNSSPDWPWLEDCVTYCNGRIPQALLNAGMTLQDEKLVRLGLRTLEWLMDVQTAPQGHLAPIGTNGWYRRGRSPARFDQQPVEAAALMDACIAAFEATGAEEWIERARMCFEWFMGKNDLGVPLYDYATGGCRDGLHPERVNLNQGAEATTACLMAVLAMHRLGLRHERRKIVTLHEEKVQTPGRVVEEAETR